MRKISAITFLFAATSLLAQARDFSNVKITATKVAGTVYMLTGSGGIADGWESFGAESGNSFNFGGTTT